MSDTLLGVTAADRDRAIAQRDVAIGAFHELDGLIDLASRWLNDSTLWEGDEYLAPKFQELRERVACLTKGSTDGR